MHRIVAYVDDQLVAREFNSGDVVQRANYRDYFFTPYYGRVIASYPETGFADIQWPWGVERESASNLIKINMENSVYYPLLETDQSYSTHEQSRHINDPKTLKSDAKWRKSIASRVAERFEKQTLPLWREACRIYHNNINEIQAFRKLSKMFSDDFSSETIRLTVANLYELGRRLAIYWGNNKRRYKLTKREMKTGKLECPRCHNLMKKRVYRHGKKNWQCVGCGFAISPKDIINSGDIEAEEEII